MNQLIKQPSTFMKQSIEKTQKRSRSRWSPRSGEKSALAQAANSRLGETAIVAPGEFRELSLRRGCLAWARPFFAQNTAPRLGEHSSRKIGRVLVILAWARWARLGEYISTHHWTTRIQTGTRSQRHPKHFRTIRNHILSPKYETGPKHTNNESKAWSLASLTLNGITKVHWEGEGTATQTSAVKLENRCITKPTILDST